MNIQGRNRFSNANKNEDDKKINIVLDITMLDILCKYVMSDSTYIRSHHLKNLKNLMDTIDRTPYNNDYEKVNRLSFIGLALRAKLELHMSDSKVIFQYVVSKFTEEIDFIDVDNTQLSINELQWVNDTITEALHYSFAYNDIDRIQEITTRFKSTDYRYRGEIVAEFEQLIDEIKNNFRQARVEDFNDVTFTLQDQKFEDLIEETYKLVTNPNRRLICGMQGLNEMTNGGFEAGRVYMLIGTSGVGKSITLLNLLYQIKMANVNYKPKDPTKIPCICLLTMENTITETVTRLFDMVTSGNGGMQNYTLAEVVNKLRTEGELKISVDSPIDIVIKYKPNKSVDTNYLYTLYDELEDNGHEMICLLQDHIKRIRSTDKNSDLRIALGDSVNEFKVFAADKGIPLITVSHLNRDASKIVDSGDGKQDLTRMLGRSNVGESMLMIDNLDMAIIINKEFDKEGNEYIVFSTIKMREKTDRKYIAQPMVGGSGIRLVEDLYSPVPLFRESLHVPSGLVTDNFNRGDNVRKSTYSDISALSGMFNKDREDNLFEMPRRIILKEEDLEEEVKPMEMFIVGAPSQPVIQFIEPIYFFDGQKAV